jgi:predicted N-acetyltransferase YhbS
MIRLINERSVHVPARESLLDAAFGPARFTKTSERLRDGYLPAKDLSLVGVDGEEVVATVRLWHVSAGPRRPALLLGPLAVAADRQGEGLGSAMMRRVFARASMLGHRAILLVGDAAYYERFGFDADLTGGLWLPGPVERERFLGLELVPGALNGAAGLVSPTGQRVAKPDLRTLVAAATADERLARAA